MKLRAGSSRFGWLSESKAEQSSRTAEAVIFSRTSTGNRVSRGARTSFTVSVRERAAAGGWVGGWLGGCEGAVGGDSDPGRDYSGRWGADFI